MRRTLFCGDGAVDAELPDDAEVLRAQPSLPPLADPEATLREALRAPVAHEPLERLVGPASRITIAFDDLTIPVVPMAAPDFRMLVIGVLLDTLHGAGVKPENVRLLVANAL